MSEIKAPVQVRPDQALSEAAALAEKMAKGAKLFSEIRDEDVAIATTPKDEVWRQDKAVLYRYRPLAEPKVKTPVLIVYGLIGRYTMADLQEDRSLVRNLLNLGVDLYVLDWGNPTRADRWLTIDDYVEDYIAGSVEVIRDRAGMDKVGLLGICEGGVFTLCYAALHPETVSSLVLTITPVDFHGDLIESRPGHGFINLWTRSLKPEDIDRLIEAHGILPGEFMGSVFSMMTPMRTLMKYNLDMLEVMDDQKKFMNFLRMEKWIADRPHHPGEAAKQWLKDLYQDNKLVKNEFELGGRKVDLRNITMPVLNVFARDDHIIPPATSQALKLCVGSKDYRELALPGGHVGVFVGGKSQGLLGSGIANWLAERDEEPLKKARGKKAPAKRTRAKPK
jgi:polyhydroxyalkanoate synthase subunit PhaC